MSKANFSSACTCCQRSHVGSMCDEDRFTWRRPGEPVRVKGGILTERDSRAHQHRDMHPQAHARLPEPLSTLRQQPGGLRHHRRRARVHLRRRRVRFGFTLTFGLGLAAYPGSIHPTLDLTRQAQPWSANPIPPRFCTPG